MNKYKATKKGNKNDISGEEGNVPPNIKLRNMIGRVSMVRIVRKV